MIRLMGLTGGIATGKTVVANILAQAFDAVVIDADHVGHMLLAPSGPAYAQVVATFGRDILAADGTIDRRRLGTRVFQDPEQRRRLESILHPLIIQTTQIMVEAYLATSAWLVVVSAPLMLEVGTHAAYPLLVVTDCPESVQIQRLVQRDGISPEEAVQRIRSQWPGALKRRYANVIIDTSGTLAETRGQVLALVHRLWPAHPRLAEFEPDTHPVPRKQT